MNDAARSVNLCDGATAFPESYTGDIVWMAAHRTTCGKELGFGKVETLVPGDQLQWKVGGVTKTYEVFDSTETTLAAAHYAMVDSPEGTALMLQTSKSTESGLPRNEYWIYIKYARLINTDPPPPPPPPPPPAPKVTIDIAGVDASGNWALAASDRDRFHHGSSGLYRWGGPGYSNLAGDVNGDGLDDLIAKDFYGNWYVALNNGARFTPSENIWLRQWAPGDGYRVDVGDFNGDGRDDLIAKDANGTWYVALSHDGYFTPSRDLWLTQWAAGDSYNLDVGDFNGDGRDDLVAKDENGTWYIAQSYGTGFTPSNYPWLGQWAPGNGYALGVGDYNGDGRDDVAAKDANGTWYIALSDGIYLIPQGRTWLTGWAPGTGYSLNSGDFNGDGRDDLIANDGAGGWFVALSNGTYFTPSGYPWLTGRQYSLFVVGNFAGL